MENNRLHIGSKAPDFVATSTTGPLKMSDYEGKWVVFFSHPGDFTPVCTTEFIAFANANEDFVQRNAQLIGLSIDSNPSHLAWVHAIHKITGVTIPFPVIADRMGNVARQYGMIAPDVSNQETVRNVLIIDPEQVIRAILIYPMTNGRNIPEILRLLIALQVSDEYKVVTPANWQPEQPTMVSPPKTYDQLVSRDQNPQDTGLECKDWFWCYNNVEPQLARALPARAREGNPGNFSPIQNTNYDLDELTAAVETLANCIEATGPAGTQQEQRNQFLMLKGEIERLEERIDLLKEQAEEDYRVERITREEYRAIYHTLDSLDDRLDHAEDQLKRIFGMDD